MLLALAFAVCAFPPSPLGSCAWVRAENDGAGAGFVVDVPKRLLLTCRHVVADRKSVDVFFPWYEEGALVTDRRAYLSARAELRARGRLVTGKVLRTSDERDLALVELESLPPGVRAARLANRPPAPGQALAMIGHRLDLDTLWNVTTGPLRASGRLPDGYFWRGKKLGTGLTAYVAQLPTEEGDSGGPVFDGRGEVVGMNCALRRTCPLAAVVVSAADLRAFLGTPGAEPNPEPHPIAARLVRATVWVKPTATDLHLAGALIEPDLVLTCARGLTDGERVGIALPVRRRGHWVSERAAYADPLGLHLRGAWRTGTVLARDPARDLALVRLDAASESLKPLPLAESVPRPGAALHAVGHPGGLEFAWVYAGGSVRQRGPVALGARDAAPRVGALVCQLPAQGGSPGGPIANERGELVGVLSAREGAQLVGYAADADEVRGFLDAARRDRPARTLAGLVARVEAVPATQRALLARALARRGAALRTAGQSAEAHRDLGAALALDPACVAARYERSLLLDPEPALAELDAAVSSGAFHRDALVRRAALATARRDFRKARGDCERVLSVFPADGEGREGLARALLGLGEDVKAAAALGDALRADPARLPSVAGVMCAHADALAVKFPDAPASAADWLALALTAAQKGTRDPKHKAAMSELLKTAGTATSDADRLRALRAGVDALR